MPIKTNAELAFAVYRSIEFELVAPPFLSSSFSNPLFRCFIR